MYPVDGSFYLCTVTTTENSTSWWCSGGSRIRLCPHYHSELDCLSSFGNWNCANFKQKLGIYLRNASKICTETQTDCRYASLCTTTNKKKLATFLFLTAKKTNYISKCLEFPKKLIDTIATSIFYLKCKENNENDMAAQVFWLFFIPAKSAQQLISTVLPFHHLYFPCPSLFSVAKLLS